MDAIDSGACAATLDLLLTRASAVRLVDPGPTPEQVETMLKAAVTAADHGRIRPWRFVVMRGDGRRRLGDLMVRAQRAVDGNVSDEELAKTHAKAMRAPVVIAVVCKPDLEHKVRVFEQQLAAAAACSQLMLAAKALGFGATWKTGEAAYHPIVRSGLGFGAYDAIIGFIYVGTEAQSSPIPRASIDSVAQYWNE